MIEREIRPRAQRAAKPSSRVGQNATNRPRGNRKRGISNVNSKQAVLRKQICNTMSVLIPLPGRLQRPRGKETSLNLPDTARAGGFNPFSKLIQYFNRLLYTGGGKFRYTPKSLPYTDCIGEGCVPKSCDEERKQKRIHRGDQLRCLLRHGAS